MAFAIQMLKIFVETKTVFVLLFQGFPEILEIDYYCIFIFMYSKYSDPFTLCILGNNSCFMLLSDFFSFFKIDLFKILSVSNSRDPEQAVHFVGLDLGQNSLRRTSAEETSR